MKKLLLLLLLAQLLVPAYGQTAWSTAPGAPAYPSGASFSGLFGSDYLCAPQPNVLWGLTHNSYAQSSPRQRNYTETVFSTTDAGQTWGSLRTDSYDGTSSGGVTTRALSALDGQTAWMLNSNGLFRTTTGINGFALILSSALSSSFQDIHFFTASTGAGFVYSAATHAITVYRTTDGGYTWAAVTSLPVAGINRLAWSKAAQGNSFWLSDNGYKYVLRTADSGLTWTSPLAAGTPCFEDELRGLAFETVGTGTAYEQRVSRTLDGGLTWVALPSTTLALTNHLVNVTALPGLPGAYLGATYTYTGATATNTTIISYNRGDTWQTLGPGQTSAGDALGQLVASSYTQVWGLSNMVARYTGAALGTRHAGSAAPPPLAYPNPSTGLVWLAGLPATPQTARVYDATGRLCLVGQVSDAQRQLNLAGLPTGLYQLLLTSADNTVRRQPISKE